MLKHITIAGRKLRVTHLPMKEQSGSYHHDSRMITISEELEPGSPDYIATVAHEMIHAALWISGVGFGLPDSADEQVTRCIEQLFLPAYEEVKARIAVKAVSCPSGALEGTEQGEES